MPGHRGSTTRSLGANAIPARGGYTLIKAGVVPATPPAKVYGSSYPDAAEYPAGYGASTQAR
ncbi:hypothetical protein ABZ461_24110 [Actinacidiphila glaucinigra]|uniref:hypothetical protein n=1 Tax=Actinacidiphila glaucinigra TaxID=235986 RepID=UPI0033C97681